MVISPRKFSGIVKVPPSKSHTIRQIFIASLADGVSQINNPLDSLDTRSCICACRSLGAEITEYYDDDTLSENEKKLSYLKIEGNCNFKKPVLCNKINAGNSGTTLFFALAVASLQKEPVFFTGDAQLQKRSASPLLDALCGLGAEVKSAGGCVPITVKGALKGGNVILPCETSQYLSALLIACPLTAAGCVTEIKVPLLNERPYIGMTLSYLDKQCIPYKRECDYSRFTIPGGSSWNAFNSAVTGDFSSAAFPAAAAAITGGEITLTGLDPNDTQGDKYFFSLLEEMGCEIKWDGFSVTVSRSGKLRGGTFDLNDTPDLFPAAAAVAAFANGDTSLVNVSHARLKETDRIAVMAQELQKLGVNSTLLNDGLKIHGKGKVSFNDTAALDGKNDHRIIMALSVAALGCRVPVKIINSGNTSVSYPGFFDILKNINT